MMHSLKTKTGDYNKARLPRRHILLELEYLERFDNSKLIGEYALAYVTHTFAHETMDEAAERVAGELKDESAKMRFKREVRKLRKIYPEDECQ